MATALMHELVYPGYGIPTYQKRIEYGKCSESPNVENHLWFVTIPKGSGWKEGDRTLEDLSSLARIDPMTSRVYIETREPEEKHTFLVAEQYARPTVFDDWKRDIAKWKEVAHKVFEGNWCVRFEILYKDLPVSEYIFRDGSRIKYAYSKTREGIDLYYVAFQNSDLYVVPHEFINPDFFERMGTDKFKWNLVKWGFQFASYGLYDEIAAGNLSPGMVNNVEWSTPTDVYRVVDLYEDIVSRYQAKPKDGDWDSMDWNMKKTWIKRLQHKDNELIPILRESGV